ncbi:MAG: hypothetical protein IJ690_00790 [Clostridia bacterium]|nr:hypothetical protein [Clostridia bacterium]
MLFIGIVTDSKSEKDIEKLLTNNKFLTENNVIFIKEKNIDNIKNVHFDTVVINRKFEKEDELNKLLENTKNVVINMDTNVDNTELNVINSNIITYGFNSKSSITISSVTDDDVLICVQRNIYNNFGEIEVQEIKIENNENYNIYDLIIVLVLFLVYLPEHDKININGIK